MSRRPRASTRNAVLRERSTARRHHPGPTSATSRDTTFVTPIEPRRQRRRFVALKIVIGTALVTATLYVGGQWALHSSFLRVQHVALSGEVHETSAQILSVTHLDAHPAMIDLSTTTMQHELSVFPWIGSISVIKRWPHTVQLTVHEVTAVAVAFDAHHVLCYVGSDGRDLGAAPSNVDLATIQSSPTSLAATAWPYRGAESAAAVVASQLPVAFAAQVREIVVDAQGNVTLQLTTPLRFFLGPATNLNAKFVAVASAIAHGTFAAGDVVDVTTPSELSVSGPSPS